MKSLLLSIALCLAAAVPCLGADAPQIPPGELQARERLNTTPRHGEWVEVPIPGSDMKLKAWIVYPERKDKAPVVIVIHEIYGLSDWIRGVCDQLAADGFIAIAPDLLTGKGKDGAGTDGFPDRDAVTKAVRSLKDDEVTSGLNATWAYAAKLPSAAAKFATVGFCWGGTTSFRYATVQPDLGAAVVYYGTSPESGYEKIKAPVLGLYGANDSRVGATVPGAEAKMKELKKPYLPKTYDGAGHGFLRQQDGQDGANKKASEQAWAETVGFLREHLN
ncbi:MAG: dienelactone hydrolase family protein [Candidatus Sumerlaeaceae bacterium]|nr:dienelactone hydrolase family protein [Candidatus Sumerlaeaceae bacterium]